jgi:hypothetical protein
MARKVGETGAIFRVFKGNGKSVNIETGGDIPIFGVSKNDRADPRSEIRGSDFSYLEINESSTPQNGLFWWSSGS